jgi:hypothetical protein
LKNPFDPITNPSLFFRKDKDIDGTTSVGGFANRVARKARKNQKEALKLEIMIKEKVNRVA